MMRNSTWTPEPGNELIPLALLYFEGGLEDAEAAAFEARLAEEQIAREALCEAVRLSGPCDDGLKLLPSRAYRERVRGRLYLKLRPAVRAGARWQRRVAVALFVAAGCLACLILGGLLFSSVHQPEAASAHRGGRRHHVRLLVGSPAPSGAAAAHALTKKRTLEPRTACCRRPSLPNDSE